MNKAVIALSFFIFLNLCTPGVRAEISQDLDPMMPADSQKPATETTAVSSSMNSPTSLQGSDPAVKVHEEKTGKEIKTKKEKAKKEKIKKSKNKKETPRKEKTKKNSSGRSASKKEGKSISGNSKGNAENLL